jgi:excinuclease ABC subunit A
MSRPTPLPRALPLDNLVRVRGAREHNLKSVDVDIPRNALVVFTGISGSGKSSLAFGTLYAEAQRRYFESVAPYARRLIDQVGVPDVDSIEGLPPAVALQQQRGTPSTRSSVGSVTTLSNFLRMLYSRAGTYRRGRPMLHAEDFSPNTPQGACPTCHGLGYVYEVTERSMVPDDSLSIRERAVAAWPPAWHGQNLRDILVSLGYDIDSPWRDLPRKDRDWILFTDEQPTVPVYAGYTPAETRRALKRKEEPSYMGTFTGARKYVLQTFSTTQSALMKKRVARFMTGTLCPTCKGKRLKREALEVSFAGYDIGALSQLSLTELARVLAPAAQGRFGTAEDNAPPPGLTEEKRIAAQRIARNVNERVETLRALGLGYLSIERSTPTLSPGELQRLRLATQIRSNLFGVIYVLDEPSAGLHPADTEALITALDQLKRAGNSLFVVEHDLDLMRHADWIVDVGPEAGSHGGRVLYSGPPSGLRGTADSHTARYLFGDRIVRHEPRTPRGWLRLTDVRRNNLKGIDVEFPLGVFTAVTGVSGSGKSSLVSQSLVELVAAHLGHARTAAPDAEDEIEVAALAPVGGRITGPVGIKRLVTIDQKPIGRTPRSNLATYTGLFDAVRALFAATPAAKARRYSAGRFSFNVAAGRCETCEGEGFVCVELLFMPSVYAPCPTCHGARYNAKTLEVQYHGRNIAQVLDMTVEEAQKFFGESPALAHTLSLLREIGLGYLRLGQPATELSGGEAQRIKLITELQRQQHGATLYVIDEPTIGLHPADVDRLMTQLNALVDAGNTVIVAEHEMRVAAGADWLIDMGPGAGDLGGTVVASGTPAAVAAAGQGRTAAYLVEWLPAAGGLGEAARRAMPPGSR